MQIPGTILKALYVPNLEVHVLTEDDFAFENFLNDQKFW